MRQRWHESCRPISRSIASPQNRRRMWRRPCWPRSMPARIFFCSMHPRRPSSRFAAALHGRDVLVFNVSEPDDALRRDLCARRIRARLPEPRAADGWSRAIYRVAQMARSSGPAGPLACRCRDSGGVRTFGAKVRRPHCRRPAFQTRRRPARAGTKRSGTAERDQPRFRRGICRRRRVRFCPHRALSARTPTPGCRQYRSRAGGLALDLGAQRCAASQFALRAEVGRPAHGGSPIGRPGSRSK